MNDEDSHCPQCHRAYTAPDAPILQRIERTDEGVCRYCFALNRSKALSGRSWVPGTSWARCPICKGYQKTNRACCKAAYLWHHRDDVEWSDAYHHAEAVLAWMGDEPNEVISTWSQEERLAFLEHNPSRGRGFLAQAPKGAGDA